MSVTNIQVVKGYHIAAVIPQLVDVVTTQIAGGWLPIGAPQNTDVYGEASQTMIKVDSGEVSTGYQLVKSSGPATVVPGAGWEAIGEATWVETNTWLQAFVSGMAYGDIIDLATQVVGVLAVANGGTGSNTAPGARANLEVVYQMTNDLGITDLNAVQAQGRGEYWQGVDANATPARHYPVAMAGALKVMRTTSGLGCWQEYATYKDNRLFTREFVESTGLWTDWVEWLNAPVGGVLPISKGGTGGTTIDTARDNLQLGKTQPVYFGRVLVDTFNSGVQSGEFWAERCDAGGTALSRTRLWNELSAGITRSVLASAGNGREAYLTFSDQGDLFGMRIIQASGAIATTGGNIIRVGTGVGGNKDIYLSNSASDPAAGAFVNALNGNWYNSTWVLGGVRGSGQDLTHVQLNVNNFGVANVSFQFRPDYGGHIVANHGFKGTAIAQAFGTDYNYMSAPFWTPTVTGNNNLYVPLIGGSSVSSGGFQLNTSFGILSGGTVAWPSAVINLTGDGNYHRHYQFSAVNGDITTYGTGGSWPGDFLFTKSPISDRTLKYDIAYTDGHEAAARVAQWKPVMFKYNNQETQRYGYIAQDMADIDPQYVHVIEGGPMYGEVDGEVVVVGERQSTMVLDSNMMLVELGNTVNYLMSKIEVLEQRLKDAGL